MICNCHTIVQYFVLEVFLFAGLFCFAVIPLAILILLYFAIHSSDGRVVRASASGAVDLGLISSRVKAMTLN